MFERRLVHAWGPVAASIAASIALLALSPNLVAFVDDLVVVQIAAGALFLAGMVSGLLQLRLLSTEWHELYAPWQRPGSGTPTAGTPVVEGQAERAQAAAPRTAGFDVVSGRKRAVQSAVVLGSVPEGLRNNERQRAVAATASLGAAQRQIASTLIILTVLGTFIGVKDALPGLSNAIEMGQATGNVRTRTDPRPSVTAIEPASSARAAEPGAEVSAALDAIEGAFGANLLSLLGAIVLSSFAYGLQRGRSDLLTQLETESGKRFYIFLPLASDTSAIVQAVTALRSTVGGISGVESAIHSLNGQLRDFSGSLDSAVQRMGLDVSAAMNARSLQSEQAIERQLTELVAVMRLSVAALDRTAVAYAGLVKGLESRDVDVELIVDTMSAASKSLGALSTPLAEATQGLTEAQAAFSSVSKTNVAVLGEHALTSKRVLEDALEAIKEGGESTAVAVKGILVQNQRALDKVVDAVQVDSESHVERTHLLSGLGASVLGVDKAIGELGSATNARLEAIERALADAGARNAAQLEAMTEVLRSTQKAIIKLKDRPVVVTREDAVEAAPPTEVKRDGPRG